MPMKSEIVSSRSEATEVPTELMELKERIQELPVAVRSELEPLIEEVMEHAVFRGRAMMLARDALMRLRLDLASVQFDLDMTRREHHLA